MTFPHLPDSPGVYLMRDQTGAIVYVGKAINLKKRVASYFMLSGHHVQSRGPKIETLVAGVRHIDYIPSTSEREALVLEQRLIKKLQPIYNTMWKDGKSYPHIMLTMKEDFPRLRLTRDKKERGNVYFGPYPNAFGVKKLLHWIWRKKFFPLRPCNYEFSPEHLLPYEKVKSCLYLHTEECPAPCIGKISAPKYRRIAQRAQLFFQGKHKEISKEWEREMSVQSRKKNFEEAAHLRDRIEALAHMNERVTINRATEEKLLEERVGRSRAIQDLMKALFLPKPPHRIECFDISHVQGVEKVASMICFTNGVPDKANYRKFIIRTVEGIDDFKSMAEVVGRRYRRLQKEGKPFPDLVLIDGGKGQLSSALLALRKENIKSIPVAALAKEEEEIYVPDRPHPIRLPMDSPALLLLRYVRDEAHRFAVTFHRQRRNKRTLEE